MESAPLSKELPVGFSRKFELRVIPRAGGVGAGAGSGGGEFGRSENYT